MEKFLRVTLTILVITIIVVALASVMRIVFNNSTAVKVDDANQSLIVTDSNRAVSLTVRGKIVADEDFRSYQIKITPNARTITIYKGYLGTVISTRTLSNNTAAYEQFVYALKNANFMTGNELTGDANKTSGICAAGYLYEFKMLKDDQPTKQLWTSSCSGVKGSSTASPSRLKSLFVAQIPDADKDINKIWQ